MTRNKDSIVIVTALNIRSSAKRYRNNTKSVRPRIIEITAPIRIVNVVVLIPPPVELGEAPINIKMIIKNCVACRRAPISREFAPAVLGVTDWKKEPQIFPPQLSGSKVLELENSNINMTNAPIRIKEPVIDRTTLE
ncbi:hypothetical protein D3C81_1550560 [compost metagenome]